MLQRPILSKYRPAFDFAGARTKISGRIDLINMKNFPPGTSGIVEITFIKGLIGDDHFQKGIPFIISEGGQYSMGKGEILKRIIGKRTGSSKSLSDI